MLGAWFKSQPIIAYLHFGSESFVLAASGKCKGSDLKYGETCLRKTRFENFPPKKSG
jgi:hypothetical protein